MGKNLLYSVYAKKGCCLEENSLKIRHASHCTEIRFPSFLCSGFTKTGQRSDKSHLCALCNNTLLHFIARETSLSLYSAPNAEYKTLYNWENSIC